MDQTIPAIKVTGRLFKIARLENEWYDFVADPVAAMPSVKRSARANVFTFLQEPHEREPRFNYYRELDHISVLPVQSYDHWVSKVIDAKTRNMVRKAGKQHVEIRTTECDREFIEGVVSIYNEMPTRQGMRFWHYGMNFSEVESHLKTFFERSQFVGAYFDGALIGFYKLTRNTNSASLMQIISKIQHRDKAPNNALLAHAVKICAEQSTPYLQYGVWSQGGLGAYKQKHGFQRFSIPRYYLPLDVIGRIGLRCGFHRKLIERMPESLRDSLRDARKRWYGVTKPGVNPA